MAILAIVFDKDMGRFLAQSIGPDQLQNQAIVSAKLGAGAVGTPHLANQAILSAKVGANILATPHIQPQGILSAAIASGVIGGPLLQDWGVLSGKVASGAIQPDNISFLAGMISRPTSYGCVLDLDLAEGLGLSAYDKSGNNNDGTLANGPVWATDSLMGSVLSFDGINDLVTLGAGKFDTLADGTLEFWVKADLTKVAGSFFGHHKDDANRCHLSYWSGKWTLTWIVADVGGSSILNADVTENWTHYVLTFGAGGARVYIDGVYQTNSPSTLVTGFAGMGASGYNSIGDRGAAGWHPWKGRIAVGRIYNRALSADEIRGRYMQSLAKLGKIQGSVRLFNSGWTPKMWFDPETADFQAVSGAIRTSGLVYLGTSQTQLADATGRVISGAIGSGQVGTPHLANQGILSASIGPAAIGTPHIANQAVLSASLGPAAIGTPHIANQAVLSASLGPAAVGTPHIANQAILSAHVGASVLATPHLANQGILSASLGPAAVGTPHLANQAILSALVAAGVLATPHIIPGGILSGAIGSGQVGTPHLANQAIVSALIGANIVATPHIAAGGILSGAVGANVLATPHILNQGILSASLGGAAVGTPHIAAQAVVSGKLGVGAVFSGVVAANSLATPHLANQGILSASIAGQALATPHLLNQGILSASLGPSAVGTPHLAPQAITSALVAAGILATPHVQNQGILSASLGPSAVGTPHIQNQGILSAALGLLAVGTPHIAPSAVVSGQLGSGQVGSPHLFFSGMISNYILLRGASEWQVWNPVLILAPGDVTIAGANTTRSNNTTTPTKVKEIVVGWHGTFRIYFEAQCGAGDGSTRAQIYRNGAAVGTFRAPPGGGYTSYTEDIAGWSPGDKAQLYLWNVVSAFPTNFAQSFRIQGTQSSKDRINGIRVDLD